MQQTASSKRNARRDLALLILLLVLVLALAAGLRFNNLGGQSLWSDEVTAAMATRPLAQIARDAANDIHPPLYYWLLWLWTRGFGVGEVGLRSLSAVLGVLLVLAVYQLGFRLYNGRTGLAAALISAIAPFQVYYSQEARMYLLLALLATLSVIAFWGYVRRERRRLAAPDAKAPSLIYGVVLPGLGLILTWAAGLYTHYAFPVVIGLLSGLYILWVVVSWRSGHGARRLLQWVLLLAVAAAIYAPWLPIAARQLRTWPTGGLSVNPVIALQTSLAWLGLGPVGTGTSGQAWAWVLAGLALVGVLPWPRSSRRPAWLAWLTPIAWAGAPLAMMLLLGLFREAYLKFLLIASPAYALLLARGVMGPTGMLLPAAPAGGDDQRASTPLWARGLGSGLWVTAALALVCVPAGMTLSRYFGDPAVARDDYRSIAEFIVATAQPRDAILIDAPGQIEVFRYYYTGNLPVFPLPRQRPLDPSATESELATLLNYDKIYALYWAVDEADPERLVINWMDSRGYKTLDQWHGNVRLAVYVMPARTTPEETVDDLNLALGPDIELLGYRGWGLAPAAGEVTQLQLLWRASRTPARRYKIFYQLLDARDQVLAQRDSEPAGDSRPTNAWEPGETILDNHGLLIPPGTPPGTYRRIVGMYDLKTAERLTLPDGKDHIDLPPITVKRAQTPPPLAALDVRYTQRFDFGGISLLGHNRYKRGFGHAPDTPLYPGDLLHVAFYWQANVQPRANWWFDLALSGADGDAVAHLQSPLAGENYVTTLWQKGEIVRGEHDLRIPADLPPGAYRLSLVMLPDTETQAGTAYLGTVVIATPPS